MKKIKVYCEDCRIEMEIEEDKTIFCKCGKAMLPKTKKQRVTMCRDCGKHIAIINGLCAVCNDIDALVKSGHKKPSFKSRKKKRWREGNFDYIENDVGHTDIRHKLRKKGKYFGTLDKNCKKLNISELDNLLLNKNHKLKGRWNELNKQLNSGKITKKEYKNQRRAINCEFEIIRDWKKLKQQNQ